MGRQDMLKLAAYNRLRKVASAARVIRQKRAMYKLAGDPPAGGDKTKKKKSKGGLLDSKFTFEGKDLGEIFAKAGVTEEDLKNPQALIDKLNRAKVLGYTMSGAVPGVATLGGGALGYGLGRLVGGRTGGMVGAAGGAGLGLGLSALPGVAFGVGGHAAGVTARNLGNKKYREKVMEALVAARDSKAGGETTT